MAKILLHIGDWYMALTAPKWLVSFTGKIHISSSPPFICYNPKFHQLKGYEIRQILKKVQAGDIFVRRHNGYVSGLAIPGYWTHAALYVGDDKIQHATTHGVVEEDILDFFRCDSVCLLRPKQKFRDEIPLESVLARAENMVKINTPYDYEFQDDTGKVYCTEFVDICYDYQLFASDYTPVIGGGLTLLPDGVYKSESLDNIIEFRH